MSACNNRPFLLTEEEAENAPDTFNTIEAKGIKNMPGLRFKIQVAALDCLGCGSCANVCPAKNKALVMKPASTQKHQIANWEYAIEKVSVKENVMDKGSVKGSQFVQPLLEFSGACAGCGETPYAKLITQLFGDRMYIANATGCSSIWGGSAPSTPYTTNHKGHGPAWANSLFEDNAEFGLGMAMAVKQMRAGLKLKLEELKSIQSCKMMTETIDEYISTMDNGELNKAASEKLVKLLEEYNGENEEAKAIIDHVLENKDQLAKKSQWIFGGDGWAYDIGYGGLDHVLASGEDVNVFVFDTEVYSNTGGRLQKLRRPERLPSLRQAARKLKRKTSA